MLAHESGFARALHAAALRHLERPTLQTGKARRPYQYDVRGLEQRGSHHRVTDLANTPVAGGFALQIFLRCQPESGADGTGFSKPRRIVDR